MVLKSRTHQFRERAEALRAVASYMTHVPSTRDDLLSTAEQYERMAARQNDQEAKTAAPIAGNAVMAMIYAVGAAAVPAASTLATGVL